MSADSPSPEDDRYFRFEGVRLRYRDAGSGPAVLLIHGWTLDLEMWDPQAAALTRSFRVIRHDRRGFGRSSGQPSLSDDVRDVQALCRYLGLAQVGAVGMSQGARVVARLAAVAPQILSCIVLDGAPPGVAGLTGGSYEDVPVAQFGSLARQQGMEAFRRAWADHRLLQLRTNDPLARALLTRMLDRYRGDDLLIPPHTGEQGWEAPPLESIRLPALVIGGALDLETRRNAGDVIARRLPGAQRHTVPNAGHLANLDNPQDYNAALLSFLPRYAS